MSTSSDVSVGLAHKIVNTAVAQGYTPELLNALAEDPKLFGELLTVQRGFAEVKLIEHLIDCDADPYLPSGWSVEEHRKGGKLKFSPAQVEFYLSGPQRKSKVIEGNKLRKELAGKPVLNANVLDYLLKNQQLIPEEWKKDSEGRTRYIFFWGTLYRNSDGYLYVRYLCWYGGRWRWHCGWLDDGWDVSDPVALLAS